MGSSRSLTGSRSGVSERPSSSRKLAERGLLERFQRACSECPSSAALDSDPLDFVFQMQPRRLGIEVTRYFRESDDPDESREQESLRGQLLARARETFERAGGPPLFVFPSWQRTRLVGRDLPNLAVRLAQLVADRVPDVGCTAEWESDGGDDPLEDILDTVTIMRQPPEWGADWGPFVVSAWVRSDIPTLRSIIAGKERRLSTYRERADEIWLLITAGTEGVSSFLYDRTEATKDSYRTAFDRVYLLDLWDGSAIRLDERRPGPNDAT